MTALPKPNGPSQSLSGPLQTPSAAPQLPQPSPLGQAIQQPLQAPQAMPEVDEGRDFVDIDNLRNAIETRTLEALKQLPAREAGKFRLSLHDVDWTGPSSFTPAQHKDAILRGQTLARRIRGTWRLTDRETGQELAARRALVAQVPWLTPLGTMVFRGNDYTVSNQQRLLPGIYSRRKKNGELESHFNSLPGHGLSHRYFLDPESGEFNVRIRQAKTPLLPLLRALGTSDKEIEEAWGPDLAAVNRRLDTPQNLKTLYNRMVRRPDPNAGPEEQRAALKTEVEKMLLSPEVSARTLGAPYKNLSKDAILSATRRLLGIQRNQEDIDDRDHPAFQKIMGPEDLFAERITNDYGKVQRTMLYRAALTKSLQHIPAGALTRQLDAVLLHSGLGQSGEEINPTEILDKVTRLSRMGEGGLPSTDSVPDEARAVNSAQLGVVDPIRTPESLRAGVDVNISRGARKSKDGRLLFRATNLATGKPETISPSDLMDKTIAFPGEFQDLAKLPEEERKDGMVRAISNGKVKFVPANKVDYELGEFEDAFNHLGNLIPLKSASKPQRIAMGSRMLSQALPLQEPEAPLVQGTSGALAGQSFERSYGHFAGAWSPKQAGVVTNVVPGESVSVRYQDGTEETRPLYTNHPYNRKSGFTQTPMLGPGDRFEPGQPVIRSNFTNERGEIALGRNLRVAYLPAHANYEDAISVSESAAKKLTSEHMYQHRVDKDDQHEVSRSKFRGLFPKEYDARQFEQIDNDGAVLPGTEVQPGDPLVLATRKMVDPSGRLHRKTAVTWRPAAITWDHHHPGIVTDVVKDEKGISVVVKSHNELQVGDKLCYDPETHLLVQGRGWVRIPEVTLQDRVATFNPTTEELEWQAPTHVWEYDHEGPMYWLKTKQVDMLVTPDHSIWASRDGVKWGPVRAAEIYRKGGNWVFRKDVKWRGEEQKEMLFENGRRYADRTHTLTQVSMDLWLKFLGYYIAEGWVDRSYVKIAQFRTSDCWDSINSTLQQLGLPYRYDENDQRFELGNVWLAEQLAPLGNSLTKRVPEYVQNLTPRQIRIFLDAYLAGDGHTPEDGTHSYSTSSERLAYDIQLLCIKLGMSVRVRREERTDNWAKHPHWRAKLNTKQLRPRWNRVRALKYASNREEMIHYSGKVYCVTVPNHILLVSRNAKSYLSMNSGRWGDKGVVSRIVPDDQMPRDKQGRPVEVAMNELGVISRSNASQVVEAILGKIAADKEDGKPRLVEDFKDIEDMTRYAYEEAMKAGIEPTEDLEDPATGAAIPGVLTGNRFVMKLHHMAESKGAARELGSYTQDEAPSKGGAQGCFIGRQMVETIHGPMRISRICEKQLGVHVRTFDFATNQWCYRPVVDWFTYRAKIEDVLTLDVVGPCLRSDDTANLKLYNKHSIYPTRNHWMVMADGTKKLAGDLRVGDQLATWGVLPTEHQTNLMYGSLLGDASINRNEFSVTHSVKQVAWVEWKQRALSGLAPNWFDSDTEYSHSDDPKFACLNGQRRRARCLYIAQPQLASEIYSVCISEETGKKRITREWLSRVGELGIAVWFLDDGSITNRAKKAGQVHLSGNIATHGFEREEAQLLATWLSEQLDAPCSVNTVGAIALSVEMCRKLIQLVARWVPVAAIPGSKYFLRRMVARIQEKEAPNKIDSAGRLGLAPMTIKQIRPYKHDKRGVAEINVYDFTVADTHLYCAGPALVSNSKRISLLNVNSLLSHGAYDVIRDGVSVRGQKNEDYWLDFMSGRTPREPQVPLVYQKFLAGLQAGGVNVVPDGPQLHIMAMTDKDVDQLAGEREVTSRETGRLVSGEFQPTPGGLFDTKITGADGNRWAKITFPEPIPNPVMEEPIRRMLGLTVQGLEEVIQGKKNLPSGETGPKGLQQALSSINIPKELLQTRAALKTARGARRDELSKKLAYLKASQRLDLHPRDWMLTKAPVLPARFRPISVMEDSGLPLVNDANWLYRELIEARDNLKTMSAQSSDVGEERLALYNSMKAVTGLGDPLHPKLREKGISGVLKMVFGNSPKTSLVQQKLIGSTVDLVGRGVVVPNPDLDMDSIGIPETKAWDLYRMHIVRRLKGRGMALGRALEEVTKQSPLARAEMLKEMESRPIMMDRAPVLHRFGEMAFWPRLTKDESVHVSPLVIQGFNMDFDGDAVQYHVPGSDEAAKQMAERMLPSRNLISPADFKRPMHVPIREFALGLYKATRKPDKESRAHFFENEEAAIRAFRRGEIGPDAVIEYPD